MILSYLIGRMPQGLKPLSYRELNIKMRDYADVVAPFAAQKGMDYLEAAATIDWDACKKCGAAGADMTEHPKAGTPVEWLRKDGKTARAKFKDQVEMCDGGLTERGEVVEYKNGSIRFKRTMNIGTRIRRAIKDFTEVPAQAVREEDVEVGIEIPN